MKKDILLITLSLVCISLHSQGIRFDKEKYNSIDGWEEDEYVDSNGNGRWDQGETLLTDNYEIS